ncbi:TIGR03086 family metal-binding protein [Streptomyces sp. NPDC012389]|uniref:TIGR03086 family metal-binding protein n=1 Tax=unclassified Streptomyces TaxID=2593676 RepID=UPI00081E8CF9|nr:MULTISPECIES: TIGR03086 family metal-binding protein [unclassified Streptomyces]MYR95954.1 TIGR03086 family protein [Streptomyces sp. SID4937]MYX14548.1 TIGR03086 family protein [Streptomyces sp. SID8374]SCE00272.1 TIGR03086 family protein [Streptomyces sp. ScaeMP-e83]
MTQKISELLEAAAGRALPVVRGIDDGQLGLRTPCAEYDVRALLNHLFQVVVNFQALAARKEVDFSQEPEFVTGDWRAGFGAETARLVAAWDVPGAEEGTTGQMGLPARTVGLMVLGDLTVHAWDLARATGAEFVPDPDVVEEVGPGLAALAPQGREMKVFGEPFPVGEGATAFERVLAVTGRDPGWRPAGG